MFIFYVILSHSFKAPERDQEMQSIAQAGQQFAYRYLHTRAKALYVRQAIIEYNKLFEVEVSDNALLI